MKSEFEPNPFINIEDFEGKPYSGKYISHSKAGRSLANVVMERASGQRFRIVATLEDVEDALEVARR